MTIGIYRIGLADGRCYVGQSADIEGRWAGHRYDLRKGRHHAPYLQRVWDKHSADALTFEILEVCAIGQLVEREQVWMDALNSAFNVCPAAGSTRGWRHTPEALAKISEANQGRKLSAEECARRSTQMMGHAVSAAARAKMSAFHSNRSPEVRARMGAANKGRVVSAETRAKISAAGKGKHRTPETREKIRLANVAHFAANPRPALTTEHREKIGAGVRAYLASREPATECRNGHLLDADTLHVDKNGKRRCRECQRKNQRDYQARKRLAAASTRA